MRVIISLLRVTAILFNCFMIAIGIGVCKRSCIPLSLGIPLFTTYFGGQAVLALIPFQKIHKSKRKTLLFISVTSLLPVGYFIRALIDIINNEIDVVTDPTLLFILPTVLLLLSIVPLLLFLEYWYHKRNVLTR